MKQNHPTVPFERYVDDAIVHCRTKRQAEFMRAAIEERLAQCKLKLQPDTNAIPETPSLYCLSITFSLLLSICLLCNRNWYEIEELSVNGYRIFARRNI
ncbi:RNA-directed DNA polymerase domain protein [Wolbachia pipientis wUni]|nr:RNA-directed DNA polymerase domain protein [Wolbachia pipientis wUni]